MCLRHEPHTHNSLIHSLSHKKCQYNGRDNWNMFMLGAWVFFCGPYITACRFIQSWVWFALVVYAYYSFF